ncbi:unnamed protein product, partial [marine sediment metagenome]
MRDVAVIGVGLTKFGERGLVNPKSLPPALEGPPRFVGKGYVASDPSR